MKSEKLEEAFHRAVAAFVAWQKINDEMRGFTSTHSEAGERCNGPEPRVEFAGKRILISSVGEYSSALRGVIPLHAADLFAHVIFLCIAEAVVPTPHSYSEAALLLLEIIESKNERQNYHSITPWLWGHRMSATVLSFCVPRGIIQVRNTVGFMRSIDEKPAEGHLAYDFRRLEHSVRKNRGAEPLTRADLASYVGAIQTTLRCLIPVEMGAA